MNRSEYLKELDKYLKKLPQSDYQNAMEYFTEYFDEAGEERAMEELGTPREAAEDIFGNLSAQSQTDEEDEEKMEGTGEIDKKKRVKILLIAGIAGFVFTALIVGIIWGLGGRLLPRESTIRTEPDKIKPEPIKPGAENDTDGADSAEKGSVQTYADGVSTWHADNVKLGSVESIDAKFEYIDMDIRESKDKNCYLSYELSCMNSENPLSCNVEDRALELRETGLIMPSWKGTAVSTAGWRCSVTLSVPSGVSLKSGMLQMGEGDLQVQGIDCKDFAVKSIDGDMAWRECSFASAVIDTEDGDVICAHTDISERLQVDTADGDVRISGLTADGAVLIDTADGDISLSGSTAKKGVQVSAEDGDVKASALNASGNVKVSAVDGDVSFSDLAMSGSTDISTEYGDISLIVQKKYVSGLEIFLDTEDGELSVGSSLGGSRRGGHYRRAGSGKSALKCYSEGGDISLK